MVPRSVELHTMLLEIPAGPGRPKPRSLGTQRGAPWTVPATMAPILVPQRHTKGPKGGLLLWLGQWFGPGKVVPDSVPHLKLVSRSPQAWDDRLKPRG